MTAMRSGTRPGINKRYFHTNKKIDQKDMAGIKTRRLSLQQEKQQREIEEKRRKKPWRLY